MVLPNLLLIAGTGNKSGKTSLACRLIEQFRDLGIIAVKITPHFHETTDGLVNLAKSPDYSVFEETNMGTSKDTSRMLKAGSARVFFAKVTDDTLPDAFLEIMKHIDSGTPVICESPALRKYIEPGVFIIMTSNVVNKQKNINHLQALPHVALALEELEGIDSLPIGFEEGKWFYEVGSPESEVSSNLPSSDF
jgi:hypothetical protein